MNQLEPHYHPDMAAELDSIAEMLAEEFRLPLPEVTEFCDKVGIGSPTAPWKSMSPIISEVISLLIQPCRNLQARIWGLVFSFGLADEANGNSSLGIQSMADEARRLGVSRALLSHYKREWDVMFDRYGRVFGKSPEACEKNRSARILVLKEETTDISGAKKQRKSSYIPLAERFLAVATLIQRARAEEN